MTLTLVFEKGVSTKYRGSPVMPSPTKEKREKVKNPYFLIGFALKICHCFGYFPVECISEDNEFNFKWLSFKMAYSVVTVCGSILVIIAHAHYMVFDKGDLYKTTNLMFLLCGGVSCVLFIRLAYNWPSVIKNFEKIRVTMHLVKADKYLPRKLKIISFVFFFFASVEHITGEVSGLLNAFKCNRTTMEALDHFLEKSYPHVFLYIDYSMWIGILMQISDVQMTFSWTFVDLFITLTGTILSSMVVQIKHEIQKAVDLKVVSVQKWRIIREDYTKITKIVKLIGASISDIIILSYSTNLYFILVQLFHTMAPSSMSIKRIYLYFSMFLLIVRVSFVSLFGSAMYDENEKFLPILQNVAASAYNEEVIRLTNEVAYNKMVLSARGFFEVKRSLILEIAGAIVTYELVLIQFNSQLLERDESPVEGCPVLT